MEYHLLSSQKTFYTGESVNDLPLWNQSVVVSFSNFYHYEQLNQALNHLIESYDQLRLRIVRKNQDVATLVEPFQPVQYPFWNMTSEDEFEQTVQRFINEPLNLSDTLFRCVIFSTPARRGILICAHHILIDGYSTQVMASFIEQYLKTGTVPENIGETYAEHYENVSQYLSSKRRQRDMEYWKNRLQPVSVCSIVSENITALDYASSELETVFSSDLFESVDSFCQRNQISVSSFFCTALSTYLQREFKRHHFTIGTPVLNRTTYAEMNSIGLYMHILPLEIKLSDGSFLENAKNIENGKMNLFRHQKMTSSEILSLLSETGRPVNSLFDIVFDYQAFSGADDYQLDFKYSNCLSVPLEIHLQTSKNNLHRVIIRYRTALFTSESIHSLWNRILSIIKHVLAAPDTAMKNVPQYTLSDTERNELLFELNDTDHRYDISDTETISSLFENRALKHKEDLCFTANGISLTFGEFHSAVCALDQKIRNTVNEHHSIIAIIAERSPEMYLSIYAALRGGHAYLPISPEDPLERIHFLLKDSGAALVLVQDKFANLPSGTPCINVTEYLHHSNSEAPIPPILADPEDTAYVIYTSGSTGTPKGAKISHASLINRILWMQSAYPLDGNSVILQKTPYTFDVSLWEIFWWGICDGSMAASLPGEHFLPAKILDAVFSNKVTHLHFVPSVFESFLSYLEHHLEECCRFCSVKHVFLSGEALSEELVQRFYALYEFPTIQLHNLYGPTECTVDVTSYDCLPTDRDPVPIGKPIYNTSIYILDKNLELLPKGSTGELCIGGRNVGQGYLNNASLTAEKFVKNPYAPGMLYRTGDYACFREDGQILFCGRMDGQRKLHGQRLEIGEIETVIRGIPGIDTAIVDLHQTNQQQMLAVYYCGTVSKESITKACREKLPAYMVPTLFFPLDNMPLTSSGKLNRKALTQLEITDFHAPTLEAPENEYEKIACYSFKEILNTSEIGRRSNFFAFGGSSLSMISLLSEEPYQNISAADFIKDPTPAGLARLLQTSIQNTFSLLSCLKSGKADGQSLVLFPYGGGGPEAFAQLTHAAKKLAPELSLYFTKYPKSLDDCVRIANELETLAEKTELYIYSHCAGSAAVLQVLNILEERQRHITAHYIAGANIPPASSILENPWNSVPDTMIKEILEKAGASFENLSETHVASMLKAFREDTTFFFEYFSHEPSKVHCPVSLILSKQDPFTENYEDASHLWTRYVEKVHHIYYIENSTHYFQSQNSDEMLQFLLKIMKTV